MDDMAEEFGEMLRVCIRLHSDLSQDGFIMVLLQLRMCMQETLEKMRERIEISTNSFDGAELQVQQRIEELKMSDSQL